MSPVILTHAVTAPCRMGDLVAAVLRDLEDLAVRRFPQWLPGAEDVSGPGGAGARAVRVLAVRLAAGDRHFGPFLADLAEAALRGRPCTARVSAEVRAAGLGRVLGTGSTIAVESPGGLTRGEAEAVVAACAWLERWTGLRVLHTTPHRPVNQAPPVGAPAPVNRATPEGMPGRGPVMPPLPDDVPEPDEPNPADLTPADLIPGEAARAGGPWEPRRGRPHHASPAEQRLERVLRWCGWAADREWNQVYGSDPLSNPVRLDLLWREARLIVEIDDDSHLRRDTFESDRWRDVRLARDGYVVLRFTSRAVLTDAQTVAREIAAFVDERVGHGTVGSAGLGDDRPHGRG
ncbi:endonuclease domain-containing protein [Nonomuraea sp. NPDC059194]|uniref:endonuclease domain-containing protein n=1 Tax=Nonomuraea sp. NPDC059194 TaxID=3346764 RepID=UPI0036B352EB